MSNKSVTLEAASTIAVTFPVVPEAALFKARISFAEDKGLSVISIATSFCSALAVE